MKRYVFFSRLRLSVSTLNSILCFINMAKTNPAVRPDVYTFVILIKKAATQANEPNGAAKIADIMETMEPNNLHLIGPAIPELSTLLNSDHLRPPFKHQ